MSLLVTALLVGGGALAAGVAARAIARRRRSAVPPAQPPPPRTRLADAGFTVEHGDVVSALGKEAWLEHGWLLAEAGQPVAAVLMATDAVIVALPKPRTRLYWLAPVTLGLPGDPPSTLEHGGVRYERARRVPVEIEPLGGSPDPPWTSALLLEYRGLAGEALWALSHGQSTLAWRGRVVEDSELENWGGGASTLTRDGAA